VSEFVRLEVEDGVATIRIDRPKMNALNVQVQDEIRDAAIEAAERPEVRAVVVYGGERVFAAGADIKEMADMSYTDMVERSRGLQAALTAVADIPKPVVAAVTGYALGGGCELALCADVRIAADDATFGQQFAVDENLIVAKLNGFARQSDYAFNVIYLIGNDSARAVVARIDFVARVFENDYVAAHHVALRQKRDGIAARRENEFVDQQIIAD